MTLEDLATFDIDSLKESLIKYNDALNQANTNIKTLAETVKTKDQEIFNSTETIKLLQESINKANTTIQELSAQVEKDNSSMAIFTEKERDQLIEDLQKVIKDNEILKEEKKALNQTIKKYQSEKNQKIEILSEDHQKILVKKDATIEKLTKEIETLTLKLNDQNKKIDIFSSEQNIIPKSTGTIIQTYNIKGWDNRTGKQSLGGREFNKAICIVKYINGILYWNLESKVMVISSKHQYQLTPEQIIYMDKMSKEIGWYKTIKTLLQIPDTIETQFPAGTFLEHKI